MQLSFRLGKTATGLDELTLEGEYSWDAFPVLAQAIVDKFKMKIIDKTDGVDVRMWITSIDKNVFCISWDDMMCEVSIMPWKSTPSSAVAQLLPAA